MNVTLVCEEDFDGIMCAVYDAWVLMNKGASIHIHPGKVYEYNFLYEYREVESDYAKAKKVSDSIREKISVEAYMLVYRACMHYDEYRGDKVLAFLKQGYKKGAMITKDLGNPAVMSLLELSRKVANEAHNYKGFLRFKELKDGILFGRFSPKCDVLSLITHHFSNRYPLERWIIYDENRQKACIHMQGGNSIVVKGQEIDERISMLEKEDLYEELWQVFFDAIEIESRKNEKCQRNHLPLWYRKNMIEFDEQQ